MNNEVFVVLSLNTNIRDDMIFEWIELFTSKNVLSICKVLSIINLQPHITLMFHKINEVY